MISINTIIHHLRRLQYDIGQQYEDFDVLLYDIFQDYKEYSSNILDDVCTMFIDSDMPFLPDFRTISYHLNLAIDKNKAMPNNVMQFPNDRPVDERDWEAFRDKLRSHQRRYKLTNVEENYTWHGPGKDMDVMDAIRRRKKTNFKFKKE